MAIPLQASKIAANGDQVAALHIISTHATAPTCPEQQDNAPPAKDARFWMIVVSISLSSFLGALDSSVLSPALPTIASELHSRELFVWAVSAFMIACTVTGLICAHISGLFGRRPVMITSIMLFAIGSAVCGAASSIAALVLGRAIQGMGTGGMFTMSSLIMCDIVALRERGLYNGIINAVWTVATAIGPSIGGAFTQHVSWRWIFWINLPASAIALAIAVKFLRVGHPYQGTCWQRLALIDWYGCGLLTGATTSMLLAISWAGSRHPWSSWPVLLPLLLGSSGLIGFVVLEKTRKDHALVPLRIFANRTAATIAALTLLQAMLVNWLVYFLNVYMQGVLEASPMRAAVLALPLTILLAPAGIFAGLMVTKTGTYRVFHFAGFGLLMIGFGLLLLLDAHSPQYYLLCFQIPLALGFGILIPSCLPAALASLAEDDADVAVGVNTSMRNFGYMWGIAIASAVFEARVDHLLPRISNPRVRQALSHGQAYSHAQKAFMDSLRDTPQVLAVVKDVFVVSLYRVWHVALAFAAVAFLLCFLVRALPLRTTLHTKYGVDSSSAASSSST